MPTNEKEYNGYLFDQLTLIEDIERATETGDMDAVKAELSRKKRQVERKLYQEPPLSQDGMK
ncbi:MAG: hypothetical protein LUG56_03395 [Lachnospiraceae bacterium]|nr:hypothetical protein [Lachnospiraceae bacterium]MCD7841494.1 hypothetical protein [Lachnospiraceae bacterium]